MSAQIQTIETFLLVNAKEIPEPYRAKIRELAVKAIMGDIICLDHCPCHLRDALRRIIIEAAYKYRVRFQEFKTQKNDLWI
jgi:hypothetical protein